MKPVPKPFVVSRLIVVLASIALFWAPHAFGQSLLTGKIGQGSGSSEQAEPNNVEVDADQLQAAYSLWSSELDAVEKAIVELEEGEARRSEEMDGFAKRIRNVLDDAGKLKQGAERALSGPNDALDAIGPPPPDDQPPEATIVADKRDELEKQRAHLNAQITFVRLIEARSQSLVARLAVIGEKSFLEWLLARDRIPLDPADWAQALNPLALMDNVVMPDWEARTGFARATHIAVSMFTILFATAFLLWASRRFASEKSARAAIEHPGGRHKSISAMWLATNQGVLPALATAALAWFIMAAGFLPPELSIVIASVLAGLAFYLMFYRISRVALAPYSPAWRLLDVEDDTAKVLHRSLKVISLMVTAIIVVYLLTSAAPLSGQSALLLELLAAIAIALCSIFLLRQRFWTDFAVRSWGRRQKSGAQFVLALTTFLLMAAALAGYVNFAFFGLFHLAGTALLLIGGYFLRPILHNALRAGFNSTDAEFDADDQKFTETLLHIFIDISVLLTIGLVLLTLWGVPVYVIWLWLVQLGGDLTIGRLSLDMGDILAAILVFLGVLFAFKFLHRGLRTRLLDRMPIDRGIRDSLNVGFGYIGFIAAVIASIATLGVSLGSIALLLGALSIGVGFGLQNVVDNFVSGLILLIQRPIKSGDWVTLESHEGFVERVGVISTEISTFEDASVIVPNSDLISSAVVNHTLGMSRGRVDIRVGVGYGSDIGTILDVLRQCAKENDAVLDHPEPDVVLLNFNDSALDFELRVFIADIRDRFTIATELRIAMLQAFRDKDIEIPFPQQDLHVRSIDGGIVEDVSSSPYGSVSRRTHKSGRATGHDKVEDDLESGGADASD